MSVLSDANKTLLTKLETIFPGLLSQKNTFGKSAIETPSITVELVVPETAAASSSQIPMPELMIEAGDYSRNVALALARSIRILDKNLSIAGAGSLAMRLFTGLGDGEIIRNCMNYLDGGFIPKVIDEQSYQVALALQEYINTLINPDNNILDFSGKAQSYDSLADYATRAQLALATMKERLDARIKAYEVHIKDFNQQLRIRVLEKKLDTAEDILKQFTQRLTTEFRTHQIDETDDLDSLRQKEQGLLALQKNMQPSIFDEQTGHFRRVMADLNLEIAAGTFPETIHRNALLLRQLDVVINHSPNNAGLIKTYLSLIKSGLSKKIPSYQVYTVTVSKLLLRDVDKIIQGHIDARDAYQEAVTEQLQRCRAVQFRLAPAPELAVVEQDAQTPRQLKLIRLIRSLQHVARDQETLTRRIAASEQVKTKLEEDLKSLAHTKSGLSLAWDALNGLNNISSEFLSRDQSSLKDLYGIEPDTEDSREFDTDFGQITKDDSGTLDRFKSLFSDSDKIKAKLIEKWTVKRNTKLQQSSAELTALKTREARLFQQLTEKEKELGQQQISLRELNTMADKKEAAEQEFEAIANELRLAALQQEMDRAKLAAAVPDSPELHERATPASPLTDSSLTPSSSEEQLPAPITQLQKSLRQYYSHAGRVHFWSEARASGKSETKVYSFLAHEEQSLLGDALKAKILERIMEQINQLKDSRELTDFRNSLSGSAEYKILKTSQGFLTSIVGTTDSIKALNNILNDKEALLNETSGKGLS